MEEHVMEKDTIQSIYANEFEEISSDPVSFRVTFAPENTSNVEEHLLEQYAMTLGLKFTLPPTYPSILPEIEVENVEGLEDSQVESLQNKLLEMANENLGMPMIFTLVSHGREWLEEQFAVRLEREAQEEEERKQQEEERERRRFVGTLVTAEAFAAWRKNFEAELREAELKEKSKMDEARKKPTGRQLFERDENLYLSEGLDEGDVVVEVDEALFEDLEEELDEEEEQEEQPQD